jgi:stage IV sporulation protein FB
MNDNNINTTDDFPNKPILEKDNNSLEKSIGSLALFIGAFYLIFSKDLNFIFVLVLVLFIHELGHFIAMKYFNYKDVEMFFIPLLGAYVTGDKQEISQSKRAIILLAGPIPGIIIGLILYSYGNSNHNLIMIANMFIYINIFNLIPLTPLDGGNLIETLFFNGKEKLQKFFIILSIIGLTIIALCLKSYVLLIIPFFLFGRINIQSSIIKIKIILEKAGIDFNKPYEQLTNEEYWLIREQIISNISVFKKIDPKQYVISTKEKQIINQIKSLASHIPTGNLSGKSKLLFVSSWLLFCIAPLFAIQHITKSNASTHLQITTQEFRKKMIEEFLAGTSARAKKLYPVETRQCAECIVDSLLKHFSLEELKKNDNLPKEEMEKLLSPYIQGCTMEFQKKILGDTLQVRH